MQDKSSSYKTAGSNVITQFPRVRIGTTVKGVEDMLLENAPAYRVIDYIYVVGLSDELVGVLSIKELFKAHRSDRVDDIMERDLIVAHPRTHQERLAYLALSHDLKAIPIVDGMNRFHGIVPYDVLLRIFNDEAHEDFIRFGGMFHRVGKEFTTINSPATVMVKSRLPWLVIGVLGGVVTASIVTGFEKVLNALLTLAAFTPVLTYLSDAVGTQSETLAVRGLAVDPKISLKTYIIKELKVGLFLALACAGLLGAFAYAGWSSPVLGAIVGLSLLFSIIAAVLISAGLPFMFKKMKLDPALASGPLGTMLSDVATIAIYFTIATIFLRSTGAL